MTLKKTELRAIALRLAKLPEDKKQVFRQALSRKGIDPWTLPMIPVERTDQCVFPLSRSQQRLWAIDQTLKGQRSFVITRDLQLDGDLNVEALKRAFRHIVERNESLRTCFFKGEEGDGSSQAYTRVQSSDGFEVEFVDISNCSAPDQIDEQAVLLSESRSGSFDLSCDYLLRVLLLKLSNERHVIQVTMHHIVSDGASVPILMSEFGLLYNAFAQAQVNPLRPLAIQYPDYACWQKDWFQSNDFEQKLGFWKKQLSNFPPMDSLPMDNPRPPQKTFAGAEWSSEIDADTTRALSMYCREHNATLFMGLHAVLSVLLARYSGNNDIIIGSPVANRENADIGLQIGLLVNILLLRSKLTDDDSFESVLAQSRAYLLDAYQHQDVPFESVAEAVQAATSRTDENMFQVMLVLQNNKSENQVSGLYGLEGSYLKHNILFAKYDLRVQVSSRQCGLLIVWDFNKDLFNESTIKWLAEHFNTLLSAMLERPKSLLNSEHLMINRNCNTNQQTRVVGELNVTD